MLNPCRTGLDQDRALGFGERFFTLYVLLYRLGGGGFVEGRPLLNLQRGGLFSDGFVLDHRLDLGAQVVA